MFTDAVQHFTRLSAFLRTLKLSSSWNCTQARKFFFLHCYVLFELQHITVSVKKSSRLRSNMQLHEIITKLATTHVLNSRWNWNCCCLLNDLVNLWNNKVSMSPLKRSVWISSSWVHAFYLPNLIFLMNKIQQGKTFWNLHRLWLPSHAAQVTQIMQKLNVVQLMNRYELIRKIVYVDNGGWNVCLIRKPR